MHRAHAPWSRLGGRGSGPIDNRIQGVNRATHTTGGDRNRWTRAGGLCGHAGRAAEGVNTAVHTGSPRLRGLTSPLVRRLCHILCSTTACAVGCATADQSRCRWCEIPLAGTAPAAAAAAPAPPVGDSAVRPCRHRHGFGERAAQTHVLPRPAAVPA
eukprot:353017-Chlamydomonas_euryale.AAC.8